jgi:hypothetical protein
LVSLSSSRYKAKDVAIIADMNQIRSRAEIYYADQNPPSYSGVCLDSGIVVLRWDIFTKQGGTVGTCFVDSAGSTYCVKTQITYSLKWWCVDSNLRLKSYSANPISTCFPGCNPCSCE